MDDMIKNGLLAVPLRLNIFDIMAQPFRERRGVRRQPTGHRFDGGRRIDGRAGHWAGKPNEGRKPNYVGQYDFCPFQEELIFRSFDNALCTSRSNAVQSERVSLCSAEPYAAFGVGIRDCPSRYCEV